ncbi:MAG: aminotransferase [Pseudomonadota bacterium]
MPVLMLRSMHDGETLNPAFADRPVTIFAVMSALANQYGAINLGQGFPDEDGPEPLLQHAANAILIGNNQYAPVQGIEPLRRAVANANKRFYGLEIDPVDGVLVTSGASEALAASFLALLKPGDEAILFAPYYDSYAPMIEAAGAQPIVIDLQPPHWKIEADALHAALSPRTRVIAINSPHNPLGRVMSEAELSLIATAARDHNITVVCDEVYEHLVFDGVRHQPLMTFDDMEARCVRIGSAGKTFSLTGWRVGYVSGAPPLIKAIMKARQFMGYTTPAHLQSAIAEGLGYDDNYYQGLSRMMAHKRDLMAAGLSKLGFSLLPCAGSYFITADIRGLTHLDDHAFCTQLTREAKVTAVPLSAFYHHRLSHAPTHFIRFCFCKKEDVLREALSRLTRYFSTS